MQNKSDRTSFGTQEVRVGLLKFSKSPKKSPKSPTTFSDFDGLRRIPTDSNRTSDGVRRVRSESVGPFLDIFEEKSPADSDGSPIKSKKRPSESDGLNWTRFGHPTESVGLLFTSDTCPPVVSEFSNSVTGLKFRYFIQYYYVARKLMSQKMRDDFVPIKIMSSRAT